MSYPMKTFLKKYFRFFVLAFVLGFFVEYVNPQLFKADLTGITDDYYETEFASLEDAIVGYHLKANEITNTYIELLLDEDSGEYGFVSFPPSDDGCDLSNLSTYCLAVALNENLTSFEKYLAGKTQEIEFDPEETLSLKTGATYAEAQNTTLEDQIAVASDGVDLTLAVYNQLQTVYPLHSELSDLFINMVDYKNNLTKIRGILELYPSKFNGATTAQCK